MLDIETRGRESVGRNTQVFQYGLLITQPHPVNCYTLLVRHGGQEWVGHGVGVVTSPVMHSNVFRITRCDAQDVLHYHRCRLDKREDLDWVPDSEMLGLHR